MELVTEIIYNKLIEKYKLVEASYFHNPRIKSPLIYTGGYLQENYIYIMDTVEISNLRDVPSNTAIICLGVSDIINPQFDLITLLDDIDTRVIFNDVMDIFNFFNKWDSDINELSYDYSGIRDVLDYSHTIMDGALVVTDVYFNIVAYTKDFLHNKEYFESSDYHRAPPHIIKELLEDPEYSKLESESKAFVYPSYPCDNTSLCFNFFKNNVFCARLMLIRDVHEYNYLHYFLLEHIGKKLSRIFSKVSTFSLPTPIYNNLRLVIKNMLVDKNFDLSVIQQPLQKVGWENDQEYLIIYIKSYFQKKELITSPYLCSQLELMWPYSCAIEFESGIALIINVSLCPEAKNNDSFKSLALFLREGLFKAGISKKFNNISNVYSGYQQAIAALDIGNIKDEMLWYYKFENYVLDYIIGNSSSKIDVSSLCHNGLLNLIKYDEEKNSDLYHTLKVFMVEKYNATRTAQKMFIHRTTLIDRINKIQKIGEINLDDWNERLHLMISIEILDETHMIK